MDTDKVPATVTVPMSGALISAVLIAVGALVGLTAERLNGQTAIALVCVSGGFALMLWLVHKARTTTTSDDDVDN